MSFTQTHDMQGTLQECLRELVSALGHHDFEVSGDVIVVRDQDKRFILTLSYEGNRKLGSLDLPMTHVEVNCVGCSEAEATAFQGELAKHLMRVGGG
ncbi:MAG: hypothetical protein AAF495_00530 [Pseudomonadota bacterium]